MRRGRYIRFSSSSCPSPTQTETVAFSCRGCRVRKIRMTAPAMERARTSLSSTCCWHPPIPFVKSRKKQSRSFSLEERWHLCVPDLLRVLSAQPSFARALAHDRELATDLQMSDFKEQLFPYLPPDRFSTFSCGHVVPQDHVATFAVAKGPTGVQFEFTYDRRKDEKLVRASISSTEPIKAQTRSTLNSWTISAGRSSTSRVSLRKASSCFSRRTISCFKFRRDGVKPARSLACRRRNL